jgi:hypothetical protein
MNEKPQIKKDSEQIQNTRDINKLPLSSSLDKKTSLGDSTQKMVSNRKKLRLLPWESQAKSGNGSPAVVSITYEEIGLFPRSFSRVFDRFVKQVFSDVENLVIQEYRFYRYLFLTTLQCLFVLLFIPFLVNIIAKQCLVQPLIEYFWNTKQSDIFINSYQQKRAFAELQDFEEKLYFESLRNELSVQSVFSNEKNESQFSPISSSAELRLKSNSEIFESFKDEKAKINILTFSQNLEKKNSGDKFDIQNFHEKRIEYSHALQNNTDLENGVSLTSWTKKRIEQRLQQKTVELAIRYNAQSIEAMTNCFADLLALLTLFCLFFVLEIQINITKSFLLEVFFGLDDSKKSLLILLVTDLLVGYHSSNLWEFFFQFLLNHYGLPENQTGIFLLVATFPVLLDVLFKYLIFRHLNRASPATVATYHAMIE